MRFQLKVFTGAVALAVALPMAPPAEANDAFVGGLVGGMLGSAIGNAATQNRTVVRSQPQTQTRTVVRRAPAVNTYERERNREVQTALNYFGFPAGAPDGVMGRNSRSAISQYQAFLGYPASGYLTDYERTFLTSGYNRAMIGGPQTQQYMASYGQGPRSLLLGFRDEQAGVAPTAPAPVQQAPQVVAAPAASEAAPAPEPAAAAAAPVVEAAAPAAAAPGMLPSFLTEAAENSMASHCNRVSLVTSTNGGFVTSASLTDPGFALDEQFCLARTYAIEDGDRLAATVQGASAAEIRSQCEAFAPAMRPYIAMLGAESASAVAAEVRGFIVQTGAPPAAIAGNARICLGVGYRTDNAELALGSALLLEAAGEAAYGEHVGHQLMQGFGVPRRGDRGAEWLAAAVSAMEGGASPVVSPGAPERVALLRLSLDMTSGAAGAPEALRDASAPAAALPILIPGGAPPAAASN